MRRQLLINQFARTLTVSAVADAYDRQEMPRNAPHAGGGEDWMQCLPDGVPLKALEVAGSVISQIEKLNRCDLLQVFAANAKLEGHRTPPKLKDFAHDLAMEATGTGVGWGDDHPDHNLEFPHLEFYCWCEVLPDGQHEGIMNSDLEREFLRMGLWLRFE